MSKFVAVCLAVSVLALASSISAGAVPIYQPVPTTGVQTGSVEVWDTIAGVEYGKARIEYSVWQSGEFWYYAYRIFNNDYFNTPTNPDDNYHFGWLYATGLTPDPDVFETIHKFSLNLDPELTGAGPDSLDVLDTQAGSTAGGGPWGSSVDPGNIGIDWSVSLGSNTPLAIAPARGEWTRVKGNDVWSQTYAGDRSRNDSGGQYFEIASTWGPDFRTAAISAGVSREAAGLVLAPAIRPAVIPEPGSLATLFAGTGLAGLAVLRRKLIRR